MAENRERNGKFSYKLTYKLKVPSRLLFPQRVISARARARYVGDSGCCINSFVTREPFVNLSSGKREGDGCSTASWVRFGTRKIASIESNWTVGTRRHMCVNKEGLGDRDSVT